MLELHEIENFPVSHLSVSSIRQYMTDRQMFFRRYIRLEFDDKKNPALIEGSLFHLMLESYWNSIKQGKPGAIENGVWENGIARINSDDAKGLIDWGKTGSLPKSLETVEKALDFYFAEVNKIAYTKVLDVETKFLTDFEDLDGKPMPIALKGFTDLIVMENDDLIIRDHKLVSVVTSQEEINPFFEIAAGFYWFLVRKTYGLNPKKMVFDQVKKSKNRDGSPQLVPYTVEYTPLLIQKCLELYRRIIFELAGRPLIKDGVACFIPNPFGSFGNEETWKDFSDEVEQGKVWNLQEFRKNKYDLANVQALELDLEM